MRDAWLATLSLLTAGPAPSVRWPPTLTRRIEAPLDMEPDLELEPLPPEPRPQPADVAIVAALLELGEASVRQVSAAAHVPRSVVWRRLAALREAGRVSYDGTGWAVA